ncbi:MAG: laccase domain protein [Pyrinomonadaceae bacterium]|jgi:YfiH family protein|nr:MAG: laccase domain protein [Pyrinomonadaceae bacterium]
MPTETIIFEELIRKDTLNADEILSRRSFYWLEKDGLKVLVCRKLEQVGFTNGFSTRLGGVSDFPKNALNLAGFGEDSEENIMENRRRFLSFFGKELTLATAWQVHGADVKVIQSLQEAKDGNSRYDALISNLNGILVGVKTADCVPILIGDAVNKVYAAVHAGWRGTLQEITKKTVQKMIDLYGSKPRDLICAIGPAAVSKYEVGPEVVEAFVERFPIESKVFLKPSRLGHAFLNLHKANFQQLLSCGVLTENIYVAPFCTLERTDLFFSYRVEKKIYGKVGRLLSVIGKL